MNEYLKNNVNEYRAYKAYTWRENKIVINKNYYVVWDFSRDCFNVITFKIKFFNCKEEAETFKT